MYIYISLLIVKTTMICRNIYDIKIENMTTRLIFILMIIMKNCKMPHFKTIQIMFYLFLILSIVLNLYKSPNVLKVL